MNINSRGLVAFTAMAAMLVIAGCKKKDAGATIDTTAAMPAPDTTPAAPVAIHVTDVFTTDKNLATPTDTFGVRDTIYALVKTEGSSSASKLDAKWTYNGKQTVKESTQNIAPTGGEARSEFHIQKSSAWPKGSYKVEIMLDGSPAGSKDFTIR